MKKKKLFITIAIFLSLLIAGVVGFYTHKAKVRKQTSKNYIKKPDPKICEKPDGIDLSHHNVAYDWSKVKVDFCYIRATMGKDIKDMRYNEHRKNASSHKIPMGAYHFLTAKTGAKEQFKFFSSIVKKDHLQLRPMLDVEESVYWDAPKGFSNQDAHAFIREWCNLCKKHYGVSPIIYITEKLYERYNLSKGFDDCLWWIANYNRIQKYHKKCKVPFTIHQYSDKKYVEGFYGYIDCNRFAPTKSVNDLLMNKE